LTRTAVLERMCGPLCEAVLDLPGSAGILADLARSVRAAPEDRMLSDRDWAQLAAKHLE